jgi:ribonuclease HI
MKKVTIYTDGACRGNPGPGGYGVILTYGSARRELSGGEPTTTNNRMELRAAIEGLRALREPCEVTLYSDSRYLVDAINEGWARSWQKTAWKGGKAKNPDLWEQLLSLLDVHRVTFLWVRGHDGHEENERCDALATAAADSFRPQPPAPIN